MNAPPEQPRPATPVLQYVSLAGEDVPAAVGENIELLRQAAHCEAYGRGMFISGIWSVVFGSVFLSLPVALLAMSGRMEAVLIVLLSGMGLVLICTGAWNMARPTPLGMLIGGVTTLVVSLVEIAYFHDTCFVVLFLAPIFASVERFRRYKRYAAAVEWRPSWQVLAWVAATIRSIRRAPIAADESMIEFEMGGHRWKGLLLDELLLLASDKNDWIYLGDGEGLLLADRNEIDIFARPGVQPEHGDMYVLLDMEPLKPPGGDFPAVLPARMPRFCYDRFQRWKTHGKGVEKTQ